MATTTMAAAAWATRTASSSSSKAAGFLASCWVPTIGDDGNRKQRKKKRVPRGYIPIVLVRSCDDDDVDEEDGAAAGTRTTTRTRETRVLVRVSDLEEPCLAALLEVAEQRFGYGQQGVLKVPCDAQRFHHVVNMARKSKVRYF